MSFAQLHQFQQTRLSNGIKTKVKGRQHSPLKPIFKDWKSMQSPVHILIYVLCNYESIFQFVWSLLFHMEIEVLMVVNRTLYIIPIKLYQSNVFISNIK